MHIVLRDGAVKTWKAQGRNAQALANVDTGGGGVNLEIHASSRLIARICTFLVGVATRGGTRRSPSDPDPGTRLDCDRALPAVPCTLTLQYGACLVV